MVLVDLNNCFIMTVFHQFHDAVCYSCEFLLWKIQFVLMNTFISNKNSIIVIMVFLLTC